MLSFRFLSYNFQLSNTSFSTLKKYQFIMALFIMAKFLYCFFFLPARLVNINPWFKQSVHTYLRVNLTEHYTILLWDKHT